MEGFLSLRRDSIGRNIGYATDLIAGAGLSAVGKIAELLETLSDTRSGKENETDEKIMAEKRTIEQITEEQLRKQQAEEEKWRKIELELYVAQRYRERHLDQGQ